MGIRGIRRISKYNFKKETIIVILVSVCVIGFTQNAYGDNLINNLGSATVDAGVPVTILYKLQSTSANQGDTLDGCNVDFDNPAQFNINIVPAVGIVASPSFLTFYDCSTSVRQPVEITTSGVGITTVFTITLSVDSDIDGKTGGSFQLTPATTVLTVVQVA